MPCNCKKSYDEMEKYSDDHVENGNGLQKPGILYRFFTFLLQIPFGILCAALIIIMFVPCLIYVLVCVIFGLEPHFTLKLPRKKNKK